MAARMEEERWDLSTFATAYLGDFDGQMPPREAGSNCLRFIDWFCSTIGEKGEGGVRYAEDQLATALIYTRPSGSRMYIEHYPTCPVVVVHDAANNRHSYAAIYFDPRRTWDETNPVSVFKDDRDSDLIYYYWGGTSRWPPLGDDRGSDAERLFYAAIQELAKAWPFIPSIALPVGRRTPTANCVSPAVAATIGGGASTLGVYGRRHGTPVVTTVAHTLGTATTAIVKSRACPIAHIDYVQDAVALDVSSVGAIPCAPTAGCLRSLTPRGGTVHTFSGIATPNGNDVVIGWDACIPWIRSTLPVQQHVYTGACTQPGDSGAALVDSVQRVVGFAQFVSPAAAPSTPYSSRNPGISGWVWAESVIDSLSII